jgi:hypothetical protein
MSNTQRPGQVPDADVISIQYVEESWTGPGMTGQESESLGMAGWESTGGYTADREVNSM